jgi:hypothetical protein
MEVLAKSRQELGTRVEERHLAVGKDLLDIGRHLDPELQREWWHGQMGQRRVR